MSRGIITDICKCGHDRGSHLPHGPCCAWHSIIDGEMTMTPCRCSLFRKQRPPSAKG